MTAGQVKLLGFCKEHIKRGETAEAVEVIEALLAGERERDFQMNIALASKR